MIFIAKVLETTPSIFLFYKSKEFYMMTVETNHSSYRKSKVNIIRILDAKSKVLTC